jgi:phage-related protein
MKNIKGEEYKGLLELRVQVASDISRIFYFMPEGSRFVLLHGFIKKTEETPTRELDIAKSRMEDYLRRCMTNG